ncbi:TonB-dependent receptor [Thalassotalea nanhaiensis]|uniref:TonB-dependent receptor n=1 Tax=Thalassotalea nanhaiensis TaxID=3065648 RepID=A0ABY9TGP0_9GAMM|nr:TonB-dependent receptor [Colwelliaceae bacterium SQ345]
MKLNKITTALSVALLGSTIAVPTFAAEDEQLKGLEVIQVTATKRITTAQETPLSLEAINGDDIAKKGLANLEDLTTSMPNINIGSGLGVQTVSMRGMGSGNERSFEQSVGMFIDGVYMPRSRQYRAPFFDAERVEIIRGPQAVLYGLNATAGTITVNSASTQPGDEGFLNLSAGYEVEYAGYNVGAVTGGSLGDDVGARLAVRYTDNGDGFYYNEYENALTGQEAQDEGDGDETIVRGTLVWDASDNLKITTKVDYADAETLGETGETINHPLMPLGIDGEMDWTRNASSTLSSWWNDKGPGMYHELLNASIKADYSMGDHLVTATFGHSTSDFDLITNTATLPGDFLSVSIYEEFTQNSAEFRLTSPETGNFSYIAGLYVAASELENVTVSALGPAILGDGPTGTGLSIGGSFLNTLDTTTISPFVSGTYNISDDFRITAGVRYSSEEKEVGRENLECFMKASDGAGGFMELTPNLTDVYESMGLAAICGTLAGLEDDKTSTNLMPEVIAQYDISNDTNSYAKLSVSKKSGGYGFSTSIGSAEALDFDDETAKSIELGIKTRFMDGRGQANLAIYHTIYEDLQQNSFTFNDDGTVDTAIVNAGESLSQGFEADVKFLLTENLTIGASVAYLSSEYEEFELGTCYVGQTPTIPDTAICDKTGENTPFAPEFSGNIFADLYQPITDELVLTAGVNVSFSDEYYTESTLDPMGVQESYERVDARIGLMNSDETWSISVVGKNLTDEAINNFTQPIVGYVVVPGAPRTVTVQGTYNF